jgi:hypothetical protein
MALNEHAANLVDTTINAFNGDSTSISPMDGISLIDSWTSTLRDGGLDNNPVTSGLSELKTELQSGNPDGSRIQQILGELAEQVRGTADSADADAKIKLSSLAGSLEGFSQQLGGSSKMAAMNIEPSDAVMPGESGGQAPMTSTVGGESTNSGAGASVLSARDDDQLSNRTGGTTDNGSALGMDDTTGSDGAQRKDGGEYSYSTGAGSGGDDYSAGSGTQSSGVSGGSAESGSGSSGGRSQY